MFSCDRYPHLRLCLSDWLLQGDLRRCDVVVIDDGSQDARIAPYLKMLEHKGLIEAVIAEPVDGPGEVRIGYRRKQAVDMALKGGYNFLLMLDDDILVGEHAVRHIVSDLTYLTFRGHKPGAMSLHIPHSILSTYVIGDKTFSEAGLGGEANLLIPRETLRKHGHHFGPHDKGFGDCFFRAIRKDGYKYYERTNPPYEVQHLGIGVGGSIIHRGKRTSPFWCNQLYQSAYLGGSIRVAGFDQNAYTDAVVAAGPEKAPTAYMKTHKRAEPCLKKKQKRG